MECYENAQLPWVWSCTKWNGQMIWWGAIVTGRCGDSPPCYVITWQNCDITPRIYTYRGTYRIMWNWHITWLIMWHYHLIIWLLNESPWLLKWKIIDDAKLWWAKGSVTWRHWEFGTVTWPHWQGKEHTCDINHMTTASYCRTQQHDRVTMTNM